jgi:hypothetical protein
MAAALRRLRRYRAALLAGWPELERAGRIKDLRAVLEVAEAGLGFLRQTKFGDGPMSKKGITGHDEWVVTEALATALVALEQLPAKHQPRAHMEDVKKLLVAGSQPGTVNLHMAQAKCRLFPDIDPLTIYQEYGLEDGQH